MINKKYKDSVFTKLFSHEDKILDLYNSIKGTNYNLKENKVKIITLEDVLFMSRKNDLCFTIDDKFVVLVEHQSTVNNNMPLRFLFYISREYEKIIKDDVIYKNKLVKIPTPEFIVLYNGEQNYPKRKNLRLSDAFYDNENVKLELLVEVLNINYENNKELLAKSSVLKEYSYFIYLIRKYEKDFKEKVEEVDLLEFSIEQAIKECIQKGVLREFLEEHSSEVINMLYAEFDIEKAKKVWKEEAREEEREKWEKKLKESKEEEREKGRKDERIQGRINNIINAVKNKVPFNMLNLMINDITKEEYDRYVDLVNKENK